MAPATTAAPTVSAILYDLKHHKAIIVRTDGCYEYHMAHQDMLMYEDQSQRPTLEKKILDALSSTTATHEMGHHHIDHMTPEIVSACASLPIYGFNH
ncbi:hypothetical protein KUTeg_012210 [Tegillarca granosa]|uniref:Uncharacterized protein n=1 Tax=Tegillarca granosa TaxID=220873 RepID=A0ABQ9F2E4_TEGGR|nr:hypothetical protein KUTeg_012210 [Tegillarca granosa]